jgi:hypothetical protein
MAKLTKDQWNDARETWECDPREGFDWLSNQLGNIVSRQAISKAAKQQGWAKRPGEVAQPKQKSCATNSKVAQPKKQSTIKPKPAKIIPVVTDAEWEEVDEKAERLHGNSKYDQRFDEMAHKLCLLGATDADMADFFHVSESTINLWKLKHESFSESIRHGKMMADANMAERLYMRGMGYSHPEEKLFCHDGEIVRAETIKHYPPDTKANLAWLYNRRPDRWRNRIEVKEEVTISQIPWEELKEITRQSIEKSLQKHQEFIEGRYERLGIKRDYSSD